MKAGLSVRHLANILKGKTEPSQKALARLRNAAEMVKAERLEGEKAVENSIGHLREVAARDGLRAAAKAMGVDPSNLRRKLAKRGRKS